MYISILQLCKFNRILMVKTLWFDYLEMAKANANSVDIQKWNIFQSSTWMNWRKHICLSCAIKLLHERQIGTRDRDTEREIGRQSDTGENIKLLGQSIHTNWNCFDWIAGCTKTNKLISNNLLIRSAYICISFKAQSIRINSSGLSLQSIRMESHTYLCISLLFSSVDFVVAAFFSQSLVDSNQASSTDKY